MLTLIKDQAQHLESAANELQQIVSLDVSQQAERAQALHKIENQADDASHTLLTFVNKSFVLPFDRTDLYDLSSTIDDCVDLIDEAGSGIVMLSPSHLPDECLEVVGLLQQCASESARILSHFSPTSPETRDYWIHMNQLENQGDRLYGNTIVKLFNGSTDALEVMRLHMIATALENALDSFENLANVVEQIALKES
ncbi:Pit accessory protein [Actinobaculum suis]|nr:Pit accessory protein [Actinobaculum suis]OCA94338.1 Pit accessory protein [Actinobaculum suis]OCA95167.1 Pit accessory protein [Actinobaculum suis]